MEIDSINRVANFWPLLVRSAATAATTSVAHVNSAYLRVSRHFDGRGTLNRGLTPSCARGIDASSLLRLPWLGQGAKLLWGSGATSLIGFIRGKAP